VYKEEIEKNLALLKNKKLDLSVIEKALQAIYPNFTNPDAMRFDQVLRELPDLSADQVVIDDIIKIIKNNCSDQEKEVVKQQFRKLIPWRKGPYKIFDTLVDAEWQSFYKWQRLKEFLPDLQHKTILDIGANSGYYMFKMLPFEPKLVIGIDPKPLFFYQFSALNKYIKAKNLCYLPFKTDHLSNFLHFFNVIFCMGILYHQRSPLDLLLKIKESLRRTGTLVLETLTIPGEEETILFSKERYAKMRNVYFIPSKSALLNMVTRLGFKNARIVSTVITTVLEQRKTAWMTHESLADFLDPNNNSKTIEGYPAPERSILIATK
jgi:tRNA (mo5U34)-methyltransferase